jgi:hypothetical protein
MRELRGNINLRRQVLFVPAATAAVVLALAPVLTVSAAQHYGPYASGSADSGTCGNNWADDTYNRHFIVNKSSGGAITVVELFADGKFKTPSTTPPIGNQSPGACQTLPGPTGNGGTVNAGVTGRFGGYFLIPIPTLIKQSSTSPFCNAVTMTNSPCFTSTFINTHFLGCAYPGTCGVTTFLFRYFADEDQCLSSNQWQNASADVGGNKGDIRSGPPCCPEGDGEGDFNGHQKGNFSFDGDGCRDGDSNSVDSKNVGDGRSFHSTSIQSMKVDSIAHTITITGVGLAGANPMSFVFVALETGPGTPGWVSFTLGDGYHNAGPLLNGSVVLH